MLNEKTPAGHKLELKSVNTCARTDNPSIGVKEVNSGRY